MTTNKLDKAKISKLIEVFENNHVVVSIDLSYTSKRLTIGLSFGAAVYVSYQVFQRLPKQRLIDLINNEIALKQDQFEKINK